MMPSDAPLPAEALEVEKSDSQLMAEKDGMDAERILDTFEPFYTMKVWKESMTDLKDLKGKTFKIAFGQRVGETYAQFSPFDFYANLKTGEMPHIEHTDLLESIEAQLDHMKAVNQKRMDKGKKLKFPPRTIDTYEDVVDDLRRVFEEGGP